MDKPNIAKKEPYVVEVEPGVYYWCACGHSSSQPFCDGTHNEGGKFKPVKVDIKEKGTHYWCGCKQTGTPPYCDGTHKKL